MTSIAVINAGSSSIKLAVYDRATHPNFLAARADRRTRNKTASTPLRCPWQSALRRAFSDSNFDHDQATRALVRIGNQWLGDEASPRSGTGSSMADRRLYCAIAYE